MNKYFEYLKKTCRWLNSLSKEQNIPIIWLYIDYLMSVIRHRCLIRQYVIGEFWKLSNPERKKRLTYNRIVNLFNSYNNPEYIHYLNEKTDFNAFFKDFVKRDWVHIDNISKEDLYSFIKAHEEVIIKPINGVEGGGIRKLRFSNDIDINKLYEELKLENVLIEEVIKQNSRMNFGNTAVNTIRTHTFIDKNGKAHVTKAILRAGVGDTVVDNYAQGGSIYEVDIQTGLVCTYGQTKDNKRSYIHPGTNIVMLGYQIPNWEKVIETSIKAAEQITQVGFIGWDVAITSDGTELIEGNHNPDYELFEFLGSTGYYEKINSYLK